MPPEQVEKGSPQDWLRYAQSDIELARTGKSPKELFETLCFHAHQTAEKAIIAGPNGAGKTTFAQQLEKS